jgi:6-phosphofructokinase 2
MGAAGAIVSTEQGTRRIAAPTVEVKSRAGAGDSMVAALVLALQRRETTEDAAIFGIAAGSAAVVMPGTELCRGRMPEQLLNEMKSRS